MKRVLVLLALPFLAAGSCRTTPNGGQLTGAPEPRVAVQNFLAAVKAQDLQAMSTVWGTADGPARDRMEREQLEQRVIFIQRCLRHDDYQIVSEAPGEAGGRVFYVQIRKNELRRQTNFYTVPGPSGRWYVQSADLAPLQDICKIPA